jgi:multimeric flavodoxin WrbA
MSILGLHCGRRMGNSEILLKEALMGAEEASGAEVEIIRLMDLTIKPCTGCEACSVRRSKGLDMECVMKDDHMEFLLGKLLQCDALILSTPVYILTPPGFLKMIGDRVFRHAWAPIQPKVGGLIFVGGTDWVDLAFPVAMAVLPRKVKVVDRMVVTYMPRPAQVLLSDETLARARKLGRRVAEAMRKPIEEVGYEGEGTETCPLCHSNLLSIRGSSVVCPVCDVRGTIELRGGELKVIYSEEELQKSRWGEWGTRKHHEEIRQGFQRFEENRERVRERISKYRDYKACTVPPPLR